MKKLKDIFLVLSTPTCWRQLPRYSRTLERQLNALMATHKFKMIGARCAEIGGLVLWVSNHPYSSFHFPAHSSGGSNAVRPSRATILRAHEKLMEDILP